MKQTSKTGLTASPTKTISKMAQSKDLQLWAIAKPAPYILKPYSGLYNPYPTGCSLLCNHPMDKETKELLRKAKENWANEGQRNVLLAEEIEAIKANLSQYSFRENTPKNLMSQIESVPEELFRRYTETDSRPLTPAPTLASAATRASGSRRCVTPEASRMHPKAQLVLDLRRTHSQETISYSASLQEPPLIRIQHVSTRAASLEELGHCHQAGSTHSLPIQSPRKAKTAVTNAKLNLAVIKTEKQEHKELAELHTNEIKQENDEDFIKRRGKKKKKKDRDTSRGPPAFQASLDPETQVATIGTDSKNQSARTSLVPANNSQDQGEFISAGKVSCKNTKTKSRKSLDIHSYLDREILRQLRRELNEEVVDNELNLKRRKALEEALKAVSKDSTPCQELLNLQNELKIPALNADLWITLPRTFTRLSARFELPLDSRLLSKISPIEYARDHVSISSERKLLFNCIFDKFKMEADLENEYERKLSGESLQEALNLLMGRPMKSDEALTFRSLIGWEDTDVMDFRTFCGVAAVCERIMAPSYCPRLPDRQDDPCHEIEVADFDLLERKIRGQNIDERLLNILNCIKTL
ncbi:uncharacterized protein LOC126736387 [Anthonomus grandis grandis]|uniref:uncharacterized protein LOC126736387 n=1 Tax=Anthonomus grandis grandis TaxID=2921223 RepID=UPI0021658BF4|nr:uncharacterized protein LOC126736387 [Anthonomus grandis grandis]